MTNREEIQLFPLFMSALFFEALVVLVFLYHHNPQFLEFSFPSEPQENQIRTVDLNDIDLPAQLIPGKSEFGFPDAQQSVPEAENTQELIQTNDSESVETQGNDENSAQTDPKNSEETHSPSPNISTDAIKQEQKSIEPATQKFQKRPARRKRVLNSSKRLPTFSDLAQGFIKSLDKGGKDLIERTGDPNKRPDEADLKKLSYVYKIIWHTQNQFHIIAHRYSYPTRFTHEPSTAVKVHIDKTGHLAQFIILKSSGIKELDQHFKDAFYEAAPFPPPPSFLGEYHDTILLRYVSDQVQKQLL